MANGFDDDLPLDRNALLEAQAAVEKQLLELSYMPVMGREPIGKAAITERLREVLSDIKEQLAKLDEAGGDAGE